MPPEIDMSYIATLKTGYSVKMERFKVRKQFLFHLMGGQEQALQAAIAYRDSMYTMYDVGPRSKDRPNVRFKHRRANGTLSGVSLGIELPYAYFVTRVFKDGKWQKYRYSIGIYGYEKAYRLAVEHRVKSAELTIDPALVDLYIPSADEYAKLSREFSDIPLPISNPS